MARSAAAVVQGFERFDPELSFAGVLFNRIGSPRHLGYLRDALEESVRMTVLGGVPRTEAVNIPERHLGLHTADDHPLTEAVIDRLSTLIESSMDLDAFFDRLPEVGATKSKPVPDHRHPRPVRIGVARDRAFCFYYPDNLDMLEAAGAQLIDFSPIRSPSLPSGIDGLYFGGGYPELSAGELAANDRLRGEVLKASEAGMPIYGECGGFMYLCRELIDLDGNAHPLVGCFPMTTRMQSIRRSLGYREATLSEDTPLGPAGLTLRGHEFHYSDIERIASPVPTVYHVAPREGVSHAAEGYCLRQTLGSYLHLHFGSCPEAAAAFVDACMTYGRSRRT
jgi:cobyrinic acid a,c-diamide synthase